MNEEDAQRPVDAPEQEEEGDGGGGLAGGEAGGMEGVGNEGGREGGSGGGMEVEEGEAAEAAAPVPPPNGEGYEEDEEYLAGLMGGMTTTTPHLSSPPPLGKEGEAEEEGEYEMSSIMEGDDNEEGTLGQEGHGQGGLQARVRGLRTQMLLETMLELRDIGHDHLVNFLAQDGVCERFLSFITQIDEDGDDEDEDEDDEEEEHSEGRQGNGETSRSSRRGRRRRRRLQKGDILDEEDEIAVSRSFHAMLLLASAEPSEPLLTFLFKKIAVITEAMFEVFGPHSRGCFHHACRVIDYVLRFHTEAVLHIIGRSKGSVKRFLGSMVHNLAEAPVSEMLMKVLTVPSPTNPVGQYRAPPSAKWRLFESLAEWRFLLVLADEVSTPKARSEQASAAADVLIDLVERLTTDENGELLLQPVGHCPELLNNLLTRALDKDALPAQRVDCVRVVLALACRSGETHIPANGYTLAQTHLPYGVTSIPMVPNQFRSVRALFRKNLAAQLPKICECLLAEGVVTTTGAAAAAAATTATAAAGGGVEGGRRSEGAVAHPGHVVAVTFSYLRLSLVNLLVEILDDSMGNGGGAGQSHHQAQQQQEQARKLLEKVPVPLWRLLCQWFFQYPFSNLYHSLFYRLVHRVLKSNNENVQQTLLSKCRLVSSLVEAYSKGEPSAGNRGHILNLCNALRLQAGTQSPSTGWLRNFLKSHDTWRRFREPLRKATERAYLQQGLGLLVPLPFSEQTAADVDMPGLSGFGGGGGGGGLEMNGLSMSLEGALEGGREEGAEGGGGEGPRGSIDYGSPLARFLGFGEDVEYEEEEAAVGGNANGKRKKKKKKGKKKGGGGGGGLRQLMNDMDDLGEEEEEEEEEKEEEEEEERA